MWNDVSAIYRDRQENNKNLWQNNRFPGLAIVPRIQEASLMFSVNTSIMFKNSNMVINTRKKTVQLFCMKIAITVT